MLHPLSSIAYDERSSPVAAALRLMRVPDGNAALRLLLIFLVAALVGSLTYVKARDNGYDARMMHAQSAQAVVP